MSEYNFDRVTVLGKFDIKVDKKAQYGYFEHHIYGDECGGGLWFEKNRLVDADGTACVPKAVIKGLRSMGFVVPRDFE